MTRRPSPVKVPIHPIRQYVCETTEVSTQASMRLVLTSHSIDILGKRVFHNSRLISRIQQIIIF